MKKNKIFSIIGACFIVAFACLSFIMPNNKNINTSSAYFFNGGSVNEYGSGDVMPIYVGYNNIGLSLNNTSVSYNKPNATYNISAGSNTIRYMIITDYLNLYYDLTNFGGLGSISDEVTAKDVFRSYLNYNGYISSATPATGGQHLQFFMQVTGVNTDFYINSGFTVTLSYNNTIRELSSNQIHNGFNGSYYTASFVLDLSEVYDMTELSFYDFLNGLSITYSFNTDVTADVFVQGMFFLANLQNSITTSLTSNMPVNYANIVEFGTTSLSYYYNGIFTGGSAYYNSYWNDYYKTLYDNQINSTRENSYNNGYNAGYAEGAESASILPSAIMSFATLPFSILSGFLNFNLFGFNLYTLILSLCTLFLCIWLIKKIKA